MNRLKSELKKIKLIKHLNFKIKIDGNKLFYKKPSILPEIILVKKQTYSLNLYVPISVSYKEVKILDKKYIFIGKLPLLTEKGSFIINGNTRVLNVF